MMHFRFRFIIACLMLAVLACSGCSSQPETQSGMNGHARPPAGSVAAKSMERLSGGNNGPRPPGGFSK